MKTPPKIYLHDQEMARKCVDGTSIPQIQLRAKQLEEEDDDYKRKRRTTRKEIQKIKGRTRERKLE